MALARLKASGDRIRPGGTMESLILMVVLMRLTGFFIEINFDLTGNIFNGSQLHLNGVQWDLMIYIMMSQRDMNWKTHGSWIGNRIKPRKAVL